MCEQSNELFANDYLRVSSRWIEYCVNNHKLCGMNAVCIVYSQRMTAWELCYMLVSKTYSFVCCLFWIKRCSSQNNFVSSPTRPVKGGEASVPFSIWSLRSPRVLWHRGSGHCDLCCTEACLCGSKAYAVRDVLQVLRLASMDQVALIPLLLEIVLWCGGAWWFGTAPMYTPLCAMLPHTTFPLATNIVCGYYYLCFFKHCVLF